MEPEPFSASAPLCIFPEKLQELYSAHGSPFSSLNEIWADADINLITDRGCRRSTWPQRWILKG